MASKKLNAIFQKKVISKNDKIENLKEGTIMAVTANAFIYHHHQSYCYLKNCIFTSEMLKQILNIK